MWVISLLCTLSAAAKTSPRNAAYEAYIKEYREIAMREMRRHKIPASITLAQGLLESGAGRNTLSRKANNHFGIKCANDWHGRRIYHDDDARGECFRSYRSAADSYEDHSKFLHRDRYASLFKLKITDYKGWARGLKACGYATDPAYATKLIRLIEDYDLDRYDRLVVASGSRSLYMGDYDLFRHNGLVYTIAQPGDDVKSLAKEFGVKARRLRKYNDLPDDYSFRPGELVYLCRKNRRADKEHTTHVVREGDSWHSISQQYGIRLASLIKRNPRPDGDRLRQGDRLRLR